MDWGAVIGAGAIIPLLNAGIRLAVPTGLAAVGETLCQRAGVLNLSLEGMMLTGALGAFLGAHYSGNLWVGVIVGVLSGMSIGVLMAFLSVTLKTEQVINGIVLVLLAQGATGFIFEELFGVTTPVRFDPMTTAKIPLLGEIPGVGTVLFNQTPLVYLSVALVATIWWILYRTRFGLAVRAAGDRPAATDAAGIKVDHVRWIALLVSGAMAGLGGAVLVVGQLGLFVQNVSAGRGWVAIALVIFGRWNPLRVMGGALLFGITDALQLRIQAAGGGIESDVPFELFQALPYLVTIIVVVVATALSKDDGPRSVLGDEQKRKCSRLPQCQSGGLVEKVRRASEDLGQRGGRGRCRLLIRFGLGLPKRGLLDPVDEATRSLPAFHEPAGWRSAEWCKCGVALSGSLSHLGRRGVGVFESSSSP